MRRVLKSLPSSWSDLTWQQLCKVWDTKQRYGGNPDVARVAALLELLGCSVFRHCTSQPGSDSGETIYLLRDNDGQQWSATPREISWIARQALPWFDFPYGDPGEKEQKDDDGNVIKEKREAVRGYVSGMRDAMILPKEMLNVQCSMFNVKHFALPQMACHNLTWQQYRSLQAIAPQLFAEGISEEQALELQSQFLAHILTPRSLALLDTTGGSIRIRPHYEYRYNSEQAEGLSKFWKKQIILPPKLGGNQRGLNEGITLFHICFQCYQTALTYYAASYPLLFDSGGKNDQMRDALTGEVGTINTIMKYAGYAEQQQVYDSNLPFVLDILNTMTKEAKEIEKMNHKIKYK